MLDPEVLERLEEIVSEKVANGSPFTAYHITLQLRAESYWVKHDHARVEVHRMFADGEMPGYSRYLANKGGATPAWEYAPAGSAIQAASAAAPHRHPGQFLRLVAPSSARNYAAAQTSAAASGSGGGIAVRLDSRATVCVPARLVRQVALQPGDKVQVLVDTAHTQLVVRPDRAGNDPNGLPARRYTVDKHSNIRITRSTQVRADLRGSWRQVLAHWDELIIVAA